MPWSPWLRMSTELISEINPVRAQLNQLLDELADYDSKLQAIAADLETPPNPARKFTDE